MAIADFPESVLRFQIRKPLLFATGIKRILHQLISWHDHFQLYDHIITRSTIPRIVSVMTPVCVRAGVCIE